MVQDYAILKMCTFHHESESKATWELLSKNRTFYNKIKNKENEVLIEIEDALDSVED